MAELKLRNLKETKKAAEEVAGLVSRRESRDGAVVLALTGDLGSGKTTFIKFLARKLGVKSKLSSPTFLIMRGFNMHDKGFPQERFYHIDAYRLKSSEDLLSLGFGELVSDKNNIIAIEWAERVKDILPKDKIDLFFKHGKGENERTLTIKQ